MYLIHPILIFLALCYALYKSDWIKTIPLNSWLVVGIFTAKSAFGIATLYIYGYFTSAGADVYNYFYTAELIQVYLKTNPAALFEYFYVFGKTPTYFQGLSLYDFPSVWGIVGFNTALHFIANGNPLVVAILYNFVGTLGILRLFRAIQHTNKAIKWYNLVVLVGLPTAIFWSSSVLKDGLVYTFLCITLAELIEYKQHYVKRELFWLSAIAVVAIKVQMLPFVLPVLLFLVGHDFFGWTPMQAVLATFSLLVIGAVVSAYQPLEELNVLLRFQAILEKHYTMIANHKDSINTVFTIPSYTTIWEYLLLLPRGLWNTLSEPFITNRNLFYTYVALENRVLFAAFAVKIIYITSNFDRISRANALLIITSMVFLSVSGTLIPIGGALFRYRVVVLGLLLAVAKNTTKGLK